jgi:hypothetical protein
MFNSQRAYGKQCPWPAGSSGPAPGAPESGEVLPTPPVDLPPLAVLIDTDVNKTPANTGSSFGTWEQCNRVSVGGTIDVDVTVTGIPPVLEGKGGITGFQFNLNYDQQALSLVSVNNNMLLAAGAGSSVFTDAVFPPNEWDPLTVAALDTGISEPESGVGVLARIRFQGIGAHRVPTLQLSDVAVIDAANNVYPLAPLVNSYISVDEPAEIECPPVNAPWPVPVEQPTPPPTPALTTLSMAPPGRAAPSARPS